MSDSHDPAELERLLLLLEQLGEFREQIHAMEKPVRLRLMKAAGKVAHPEYLVRKQQWRKQRIDQKASKRKHDAAVVNATQIRTSLRQPVYRAPEKIEDPSGLPPLPKLLEPRSCYVCKAEYVDVHFFYASMCPSCADLNYARRFPKGDLHGRIAVVTGARLKIGFQTCMLLLQRGCRVIATTRFPRDAAQRFASLPDHASFEGRIHVYGLDLRHIPSVELFTSHLAHRWPHLDILINNAAQTVRRPAAFYEHLLPLEGKAWETLSLPMQSILADHRALAAQLGTGDGLVQMPVAGARGLVGFRGDAQAVGLTESAQLSQLPCGDEDVGGNIVGTREEAAALFPNGQLDVDLQQIDLRRQNSWRMTATDVPTGELLEVHLVNAVAPFVLCARLRPMMERSPFADRYIINVSAMEAQFSRNKKTDKHPHTNMAKAALNMLTRTSAADYAATGIFMNSVDTGWVTDEDPMHHVVRKQEVHRFHPPLDIVDGAARVVDPIFSSLGEEKPAFGLFFKDYRVCSW